MVQLSHSTWALDTKINVQGTLVVSTKILTAYACNSLHSLEMACVIRKQLTVSLANETSPGF